jgi:hypothetical protein
LDPYTGLRIRLWIRILLFFSVTFKMPAKISFFAHYLLLVHQSSKKTSDKELHKTVEIKIISVVLVVNGRVPSSEAGSVQIIADPGPEGPKTYVQIRNTGFYSANKAYVTYSTVCPVDGMIPYCCSSLSTLRVSSNCISTGVGLTSNMPIVTVYTTSEKRYRSLANEYIRGPD